MAKICESGVAWSDLNHDILSLVMMQLGVVDFLAFSGVCKSWRSLALSNRIKFIDSRPPLPIRMSTASKKKDYYCYLMEFDGRRYKSIIPHSAGRRCVGLTRKFLIFYGRKTHDLWLVDPITRHEFHFPNIPFLVSDKTRKIKAIFVYSPSISRWVFAMRHEHTNIWFSIAGQGTWSHVSSTSPILDLHAFKEKVYAIDDARHLYELALDPEPKLALLETKNFPIFSNQQQLVIISSRDSLYFGECLTEASCKLYKLDFDEMNWVFSAKIKEDLLYVISKSMHIASVKEEKGKLFIGSIWSLP